jgi:hypothetical protein
VLRPYNRHSYNAFFIALHLLEAAAMIISFSSVIGREVTFGPRAAALSLLVLGSLLLLKSMLDIMQFVFLLVRRRKRSIQEHQEDAKHSFSSSAEFHKNAMDLTDVFPHLSRALLAEEEARRRLMEGDTSGGGEVLVVPARTEDDRLRDLMGEL